MLNNLPREQLIFIINEYGHSIINDPRRCRGLLKDLAPNHQRETNLLMLSLEQKVVDELIKINNSIPMPVLLQRLAQRLNDNIGIQIEFANWAVISWALALDVIKDIPDQFGENSFNKRTEAQITQLLQKINSNLNEAQRQIVIAPSHPMIILGGSGCGKTSVLAYRAALQIVENNLNANNMLIVNSTNKAAKTMHGKIADLLNISLQTEWIVTFHGLADKILRQHAKQAKLPEPFWIMDNNDQLLLIKRLLNILKIDTDIYKPDQVQHFINQHKNNGIRANYLINLSEPMQQQMKVIYKKYEEYFTYNCYMDFAEVQLRAFELLRDNRDILNYYHKLFMHIYVDDFYSINFFQYSILRLIAKGNDNIVVTTQEYFADINYDETQKCIHEFKNDFRNCITMELDQNNRSTGNIIKAANKFISRNHTISNKQLQSKAEDGNLISVHEAFIEENEASFVSNKILQWKNDGGHLEDVAILYRTEGQSELFELRLMTKAIPYRVYRYDGLKFYKRVEIK